MLFGYINPETDIIVQPKASPSNSNNNSGDYKNNDGNTNENVNVGVVEYDNNMDAMTESSCGQPYTKRLKLK